MAHETRSELARLIAEVTPGDLTMSFFTNGGAEANENAIKLARWYTGRHKIVARYRSYHGATAGRDHAHRRPAPLARRARHPGRRADARPVHLPLPGRPPRPVPGVHRRRRTSRRSSSTRAPQNVAAVILETIVGHQRRDRPARRLPAVDPRGLRPARDPAHLRRGDGRLRPHRQVVRLRALGRRARTS